VTEERITWIKSFLTDVEYHLRNGKPGGVTWDYLLTLHHRTNEILAALQEAREAGYREGYLKGEEDGRRDWKGHACEISTAAQDGYREGVEAAIKWCAGYTIAQDDFHKAGMLFAEDLRDALLPTPETPATVGEIGETCNETDGNRPFVRVVEEVEG
jgi:hypothetical protein